MVKLSTGLSIPDLEIDTQTDKDRERVLRYIAPSRDLTGRTRLLLRSMLVIGPMGYGKTSFIEAKLGEAVKRLLDMGVDDNEIGYFYAQETPLGEALPVVTRSVDKQRYLFLFIDDAPAAEGLHARRAMAKENVRETRAITMIRHRLKSVGYSGYIFVAWASQVYNLVDITVRRTSALKVFKDYPEEDDIKLVGRMLGAAGMKALSLISDWLLGDDLRLFLYGVYSGVAKMKKRRWLITAFDCQGFPRCNIELSELERQVEERKRHLERVKLDSIGREAEGGQTDYTLEECIPSLLDALEARDHVINRLLEEADIVGKGADVIIRLNGNRRIWWIRRHIYELARQQPECLSTLNL